MNTLRKNKTFNRTRIYSNTVADTKIDEQVVLFQSNLDDLLDLITAPKDLEKALILLATDRVYRWALEHPKASEFDFGDPNDRSVGDWRCARINDPGFYFGDSNACTFDPYRLDEDPFIMIISAVECIVKEFKEKLGLKYVKSLNLLEYVISRTQDLIDWIILEAVRADK